MGLLKNRIFICLIIFFAFICDRLLKYMIMEREGFFVIKDFLKMNFYPNWGLALSLPVSRYLAYPLIILVSVIVFYYFINSFKKKNYFLIWATGLIFVGAISNLIDRIRFGHVVDYFNFVGRFPVFNLADVMIVCGVALIIGKKIFFPDKNQAVL